MRTKVLVDHDSTLAATWTTALTLMGERGYSYEDLEAWDWGLHEFGHARTLSALWHAWTLRPTEVPLMDDTVVSTMHALRDMGYEVHVVTAHPDHLGISEGKVEWLEYHGIPYDEFHTVDGDVTKAVLDYDVYVDDKPSLPGEVRAVDPDGNKRVFVRSHRYNSHERLLEATPDVPLVEGHDYTRLHVLGELLTYL